jgi:hypothetical protein
MTRSAVNYLMRVAGEGAGLKNVHPHMLRHWTTSAIVIRNTRCTTRALPGEGSKGCGSYRNALTVYHAIRSEKESANH